MHIESKDIDIHRKRPEYQEPRNSPIVPLHQLSPSSNIQTIQSTFKAGKQPHQKTNPSQPLNKTQPLHQPRQTTKPKSRKTRPPTPKMPQPKPVSSYSKPCSLCAKPRDILVRCQIDPASVAIASASSTTTDTTSTLPPTLKPDTWHFVCPGSCWRLVSGGVIDGDLKEGRQGYRYGGMWKNRHAGVSAKVPRRLKGKLGREGEGGDGSEEGEDE